MKTVLVLCGESGAGKTTAATSLVDRLGFKRVSLATPLKKIVKDLFSFDDSQVFGTSGERNVPDARYPRPCPACGFGGAALDCHLCSGHGTVYLTPREAMQRLGEAIRGCHRDTLTVLAQVHAMSLVKSGHDVVVDDGRYANEMAIFRAQGAKIVCIRRPGCRLTQAAAAHSSERELSTMAADSFDAIVENLGTQGQLCAAVEALARSSWPRG